MRIIKEKEDIKNIKVSSIVVIYNQNVGRGCGC